jgi:excinuclease ABC subunit A
MHFLPDVWVQCESCNGDRYVPETLEVRFKEKSIADVLRMQISEAASLFESIPKIRGMLRTLEDVGLGYLELGQAAPTLSGGEAQRVKLAAELGRPSTGKTLYILDEPTTGLHFDDLKKLLRVLHRLVDGGNTVICIEHNLEVIKTADWVIDLGLEAGEDGGWIVVQGTPEQVAAAEQSHTGAALQPILQQGPLAEREFHPPESAHSAGSASRPIEIGESVKMPWELDGRSWHTVDRKDHNGEPVGWDPAVLIWLVKTIESVSAFQPADWNHRTRIEITAGANQPWFCHFLTGFKDLLEMAVRVPHGTFSEPKLRDALRIKTLDEREDLPIYGQWSRVRIRPLKGIAGGWGDLRLSIRDFKDVNKPAFRAFLKSAAQAYFRHIELAKSQPALRRPWKTEGKEWHLSQKSMSARQTPRWRPADLMALIGRFRSLQPDLELNWTHKTAVQLFGPGGETRGKIVTNMGRGLRVELKAPRNVIVPAHIEGLGEEPEIRRGPNADWVIFWARSLDQIDAKQLRGLWGRRLETARTDELQSA